jgi:hypothetical protein
MRIFHVTVKGEWRYLWLSETEPTTEQVLRALYPDAFQFGLAMGNRVLVEIEELPSKVLVQPNMVSLHLIEKWFKP